MPIPPARVSCLLLVALFAGGCFLDRSGTRPDDAGPLRDAGEFDSGPALDGGGVDAGRMDGGSDEAGPRDAGPDEAGPRDAGPPDAGPPDTGVDAGPASCFSRYGTLANYFSCTESATACEFFTTEGAGCGAACVGAGGTCVDGVAATNNGGGRCNATGSAIGCGISPGAVAGLICTCTP